MKILVLGAGLMARGIVHDLLRNPQVDEIVVADAQQAALAALQDRNSDPRLTWCKVDAADTDRMRELLTSVDGLVSAAHYGLNVHLTELAIETGTHMVDLGGNNNVVAQQLSCDAQARAAGVSIVPDCGLAPGMASLLVAWGARHLPWATSAHIRVGGLPERPVEPLRYERLFNVQGLINEYVEVPVVLRDGRMVEVEPLGDLEHVELPEPIGVLEAFNTSGGVSTLPSTFAGRFHNIDYKTLRYPGHAHAMRWLMQLGLFDWNTVAIDGQDVSPRALLSHLIEEHVPKCERDITVVVVRFEGVDKGEHRTHQLELIDSYDAATSLTAMMRTTAFPAAIVAQMQCAGEITRFGVVPQELAVNPDRFLDELALRGVDVRGRELTPVHA
jgi:lysine 6-dehydrogenase